PISYTCGGNGPRIDPAAAGRVETFVEAAMRPARAEDRYTKAYRCAPVPKPMAERRLPAPTLVATRPARSAARSHRTTWTRQEACMTFHRRAALALAGLLALSAQSLANETPAPGSNPLFRDRFTADPAPLVVGDRLYLYVGHDEARGDEMFNMREWL